MRKLVLVLVFLGACAAPLRTAGLLVPPASMFGGDLVFCEQYYESGYEICLYVADGPDGLPCGYVVGSKNGEKEWTLLRHSCITKGEKVL